LKNHCERQVVYAITSLPEARADAATLLHLARRHWAVENELFHVRDMTFGEDACRVRTGAAPCALALVRDATLNIIRSLGQKPRPARETFAAKPKAAIRAAVAS
jgi:predicted transposase YbfD/YdcC